MKSHLGVWAAATLLSLCSASPAGRSVCNRDNCLRAVDGVRYGTATQIVRLEDCSSFLSFTVSTPGPTTTTTVTGFTTVTDVVAVVTEVLTQTTGTVWPTTINTEVTPGNFRRQDAASTGSAAASTIRPTALPAYVAKACTDSARFSSACVCAGVQPHTTTLPVTTSVVTVTLSPKAAITESVTAFVVELENHPTTLTTPLVNTIECGALIEFDEGGPAYRTRCEQQGTGNRTLVESVSPTDWDNCLEFAFDLQVLDWKFDIKTNTCKLFDAFSEQTHPLKARNVTTPRSQYVYAYIIFSDSD